MKEFPVEAQKFYELRDDRTNRSAANRDYQRSECSVRLAPAASGRPGAQAALLVAANLLSRWCRKVTVSVPQVDALPILGFGGGRLSDIVLAQMTDADPF